MADKAAAETCSNLRAEVDKLSLRCDVLGNGIMECCSGLEGERTERRVAENVAAESLQELSSSVARLKKMYQESSQGEIVERQAAEKVASEQFRELAADLDRERRERAECIRTLSDDLATEVSERARLAVQAEKLVEGETKE